MTYPDFNPAPEVDEYRERLLRGSWCYHEWEQGKCVKCGLDIGETE